jgi:hypothetical protein
VGLELRAPAGACSPAGSSSNLRLTWRGVQPTAGERSRDLVHVAFTSGLRPPEYPADGADDDRREHQVGTLRQGAQHTAVHPHPSRPRRGDP